MGLEPQTGDGHAPAPRAGHDALTGSPDRALVLDRLRQGLARVDRHGRRMALLVIDLDPLELVGDSRGLEAGDGVRRVVARRLSGLVRATDTVGRLGGGEFAIVCEDFDDALARRATDALAAPVPSCGGVEVGEALDLDVVAEGVGTLRKLKDVRRLGCGSVQGPYVGRPLPADEARAQLPGRSPTAAVA